MKAAGASGGARATALVSRGTTVSLSRTKIRFPIVGRQTTQTMSSPKLEHWRTPGSTNHLIGGCLRLTGVSGLHLLVRGVPSSRMEEGGGGGSSATDKAQDPVALCGRQPAFVARPGLSHSTRNLHRLFTNAIGCPLPCGSWSVPDTPRTPPHPLQTPKPTPRGGGGGDAPQYANYWAPLTRKRHILPHPAQPHHTNYWAPRKRKRHQQEHQRPTESSDRRNMGRTGDCPGPCKETTTRRNVTQGGCFVSRSMSCIARWVPSFVHVAGMPYFYFTHGK